MKLAAYLEAHGMTLQEFGGRLGVSHTTVMRWASGTATPRGRAMLRRIAEATDGTVTAADFFPEAAAVTSAPPRAVGFGEAQAPFEPEARALGLDADAIAAAALKKAISEEKARRWAEENREAIEAYNRYFEENDTPLAKYRAF